ncbi:MAG: PKD domain-containing protein [Candidatus Helarchaeota archaeon]
MSTSGRSILPKFPNKGLLVVAVSVFTGLLLGANAASLYFSTLTPEVFVTVDYPVKDVDVPFEFFGMSLGGTVQYLVWNFHDGTPPIVSNSTSMTHYFSSEGTFLVSLTAYTLGGISTIGTVEVEVKNDLPSVQIDVPGTVLEDEPVTLEIATLYDTFDDVETIHFQWVLGDGENGNLAHTTYI